MVCLVTAERSVCCRSLVRELVKHGGSVGGHVMDVNPSTFGSPLRHRPSSESNHCREGVLDVVVPNGWLVDLLVGNFEIGRAHV